MHMQTYCKDNNVHADSASSLVTTFTPMESRDYGRGITRYTHAHDVPHAEVDVRTEIMAKRGLYEVEDFEDVSEVTRALPNTKLCGVVRSVSPMKKSKTCACFDGEISDGKSTM